MPQSLSVELTTEEVAQLKEEYRKAKEGEVEIIYFKSRVWDTEYTKYVLEYLDIKSKAKPN